MLQYELLKEAFQMLWALVLAFVAMSEKFDHNEAVGEIYLLMNT